MKLIQDLVSQYFFRYPANDIREASMYLKLTRQQIYSARYRVGLTTKAKRTTKQLYRKIISSVYYCPDLTSSHRGTRTNVYSMTYEPNHIDRATELIAAIESHFTYKKCYNPENKWGYDDRMKAKSDSTPLYPKIEVFEK